MQPYERWQIIKPLAEAGVNDYEISRRTGLVRQTVYWTRKKFEANPNAVPGDFSRTEYDWKKVQAKYDSGCSWRELMEIFGFAPRSIQLAIRRGDFVTNRSASEASKNAYVRGRSKPTVMSDARKREMSITQSTSNRGGKSKWFAVDGIKVQGTWERDLALRLSAWGVCWKRVNGKRAAWPYRLDGKLKHYTPDFYLPDFKLWVEVKGHWWGEDMRKMLAVFRHYPRRKIVIIGKAEFKSVVASETLPTILGGIIAQAA